MDPISLGQRIPLEVRRGASRVIRCAPERAGEPVVMTSAAVEVLSSTGAVVQSGDATVSEEDGQITFEIEAETTADVDLESGATGWEVVWTLTLDGEDADTVHREPLDVVLYEVQPQVTLAMLTARHPDLVARRNTGDAQAQITEAWASLLGRLRGKGKRSTLIVDGVMLREPHIALTLALVWRGLATGGPASTEWALSERYVAEFEALWSTMTFEVADPVTWRRTGQREGATASAWRTAPSRGMARVSGRWA